MLQPTETREAPSLNMDALFQELVAIEYWDQEYLRQTKPGDNESLAFALRQERREEILSLLGTTVGHA